MALATSTAIALALAGLSAGTSYYNSQKTASAQDSQLADQIRGQAKIQQRADGKVNEEVAKLKDSTSEKHRKEALDSYMQTLLTHKSKLLGGLTPNFGSDTFRQDAAQTAGEVEGYAGDTAGMMARIDAPAMQRQDEATSYGNLATDISLLQRESKGQSFIDELRLRAIRRSPGLDALSAFLGGAARSGFGGGAGAPGAGGAGIGAGVSMGTGPSGYGRLNFPQ